MILHVSNLDSSMQSTDLKVLFEPFGRVNSAGIVPDLRNGYSPEHGYVDMPDEKEAQKAMDELNGFVLCNRHINVHKVKTEEMRAKGSKKTFMVEVQLDDFPGTYKVNKGIDGYFIARLSVPATYKGHSYPTKLVLHKNGNVWLSNCHYHPVVKAIGSQIDEHILSPSSF